MKKGKLLLFGLILSLLLNMYLVYKVVIFVDYGKKWEQTTIETIKKSHKENELNKTEIEKLQNLLREKDSVIIELVKYKN